MGATPGHVSQRSGLQTRVPHYGLQTSHLPGNRFVLRMLSQPMHNSDRPDKEGHRSCIVRDICLAPALVVLKDKYTLIVGSLPATMLNNLHVDYP
jgi:hypothetical protein